MKVAILDDYQSALPALDCFSRLAGHEVRVWNDHATDIGVLAGRLADTDALVLIRERTKICAELVARLPALKLISQYGVTPHIDTAACTEAGIVVCAAQHGRPSYATAELTWGLVLASLRRIPQEAARMRSGLWQGSVGTSLHGRTLGIWGFGRIGALVAGYGRAFGMRVLVWGRESTQEKARAAGMEVAASGAALFEQADVLSLHMRLTDATRGIVTAGDLARMQSKALIVNTSRAELIAPGALEAALAAGRPGMAALDVFEHEPILGTPHPLANHERVLCTPHIGYVERDAFEFGFTHAFDQVNAWAAGNPVNVVNPDVLPHRRRA
jgi:D-3-phosphoglycerate dehydrogenase / 2-oxoglutarate reductase